MADKAVGGRLCTVREEVCIADMQSVISQSVSQSVVVGSTAVVVAAIVGVVLGTVGQLGPWSKNAAQGRSGQWNERHLYCATPSQRQPGC